MKNCHQKNILDNNLWAVIILCCLGVGVYCNTFYSPFYFDDGQYIIRNLNIRNFNNFRQIWDFFPTRFIIYLSFALNYRFNGFDVFGYHLVNCFIHLGTTVLVYIFSRQLFFTPVLRKDEISRGASLIVFFVAAVFLTHPIQTAAVTYIYQRAASLVSFFFFLSLVCYMKSRLSRADQTPLSRKSLFYALSLFFCFVSMLTKENSIMLPGVILLCELFFLKEGGKIPWRLILPFFALSLIIPFLLFTAKPVTYGDVNRFTTNPLTGGQYFVTQLRVLVTYLRLLAFPFNQNVDYDYPVFRSLAEWPVLASLFLLSLLVFAGVRLFRRYRLISFGILWFFITLLPESSFIPLKDVIFEHRLYLPMLGYSLFLVCALYYVVRNKTARAIILILIIQTYAFMAFSRNSVWQDQIALGADIVKKSPNKARSYIHLGTAYMSKGMYSYAIDNFLKALEIAPDYSEAYYNLGASYYEKKDFDKAIFYFNKTLQINPMDLEANYYRGMSFNYKKEYAKAILDFKQVLHINPGYVEASLSLANASSVINKDNE